MSSLTSARYGKDKVRVFRVVRDGDKHTVVEYIVRALLEGDIETSYTQADNSVVVATDSIKNTCYVIAKTSPHVLSPELYALHLGTHFVTKYPHIHKAFIGVEQLKWSRIPVEGALHKHSFVRDGEEKIVVNAEIDATAGKDKVTATIKSGIKDLLVLKSSGSAFEGFLRDEYTTLTDVDDRIFSTAIDLDYQVELEGPMTIDNLGSVGVKAKFNELQESARKITLETFATDESASVQVSWRKMRHRYHTDVVRQGHDVQDVPKVHCGKRDSKRDLVPVAEQALYSCAAGLHWVGQPEAQRRRGVLPGGCAKRLHHCDCDANLMGELARSGADLARVAPDSGPAQNCILSVHRFLIWRTNPTFVTK